MESYIIFSKLRMEETTKKKKSRETITLFLLLLLLPLLSFLLPLVNLFFLNEPNPFFLFLGGFYSQGRSLQGAASMVSKWGGCLGGCSCRKQGEEKGESDGQVGWWEFAWEKKGESDGRGGWLQEVGWL